MNPDQFSNSNSNVDGNRSFRDILNRNQLYGLTCLLIGMSQLPLAFILADLSNQPLSLLVIGAGGWLLIGVGINLLQGGGAFQNGWTNNERVEWLMAAVLLLFSIGIVAAAGITLLP